MWRDSESEQDFLNFSEVAEQIATLATTPNLLPISIGVFGGWGTGKSTVLRLVEDRLMAGKTPPLIVKFDAWLYQGFDDARAALMEVVAEKLLRSAKDNETILKKAANFAKRVNYFRAIGLMAEVGVGMALGIPPGLLTSAGTALTSIFSGTGKVSDIEAMKADAQALKKGYADLVKPAEERTPPKEIEAFREEFGSLLKDLDASIVLFIDNLDRCLPDVAIGTLEAVRLFLFMPRTAFVIAADEGMIRHSVAKHFADPESPHIRDYLDKVIQVPLRVPQIAPEDLRAYMYSLFVATAAPAKLGEVQARLLNALQGSWKGDSFTKAEIARLAGDPPELLDNLGIADQLAPILVAAPNVQGNPRIVKRLLNAVVLRKLLAKNRGMNVDFATLAKLAVFERCTDERATLALYRAAMEQDASRYVTPKAGEEDLPLEWKKHEDFIAKWRAMEPVFTEKTDLRPAVFLSRDVMAPARARLGMTDAMRETLKALLKVDRVNSPVGQAVVKELPRADRQPMMSALIESMRQADWSGDVPGIHGALLLAKEAPETADELRAFVATLPRGNLNKGLRFLLKNASLLAE